MNDRLLLAKAITLLYRESQLKDDTERSADLVRTAVNSIKIADIGIGISSDREVLTALKATALDMCVQASNYEYDLNILLQRIKVNISSDDKLYKAIQQGLEPELTDKALKRTILNLRKSISNHFRELQIVDLVGKASHKLRFERDSISDINQFLSDFIVQLEPLQLVSDTKDPAVMDDVDIGDDTSMNRIFNDVQKMNNGGKIYRTGWQDINEMCQGGFRPGETVVIGALQHKYKTGFSLSLFAQLALFNKPHTEDHEKKPLLLRISFEDPLVNNLQFLYQYLKYNETGERVYIKDITVEEMSGYVKSRLQVNGFHIKMLRVDPNNWSYKSLFNKIIELESQGYSVECLMVDYLSQLNKVGCTHSGITGSEVGDLLSRVRTFCATKGITFITLHQLSTEAKNIIRGGLAEDQFVKEIAEKGYWESNRGLDRIFDLGLLIHLFKNNGETYFTIQRDKHRVSTIVDDTSKYAIYKFPKFMPIPHDLEGEKISFRKMKAAYSNSSDNLFSL